MLAIALALGSSVCFGVCDFIAGLQARRVPLLGLLIASQLVALLILVAILAIGGTSPLPLIKLLPAAGAGVGGMIALAAFFRALAIGTMSIVAPISSTGAAVPVLVGIASGNRPAALQVGGIVAVVIGIVLAGREASAVASRRGELAIIGVVASLYPIATVLLARAMLHERVRRVQEVGIVAAILGVLLVAAG